MWFCLGREETESPRLCLPQSIFEEGNGFGVQKTRGLVRPCDEGVHPGERWAWAPLLPLHGPGKRMFFLPAAKPFGHASFAINMYSY